MILKGILKSYASGTHQATVQIVGSLTTWLSGIPVSHGIAAADMVAGRNVAVLTPDPAKPGESVVIAVWAASTGPAVPGGQFIALDPANSYRIWRSSAVGSTPRTATISSVAGDTITLTSAIAKRFFDTLCAGNVYAKIANTTRGEYAWVKDVPATNKLQVVTAGDIASWVNGNIISTAHDGAAANRMEIDVSPLVGDTQRGNIFLSVEGRDSGGAGYFCALYSSATSLNYVAQFTQVANKNIDNSGAVALGTGNKLFVRDYASGAATLTFYVLAVAYTTAD